ncbi:DUF6234 family protein [Streptomyces sp. NBC_01800]|uniref:DUF6234 family protein n=1 Tax=Streptomyces sp. NBC_01800 TaxID=2975945 RepID=UPI002DDB4644|nr:DUF6234 family protein [Streptomyces sp. NBC_01800]WSA66070.1 DUF6234 family protein [Streptomyces sp. NBC_01800]
MTTPPAPDPPPWPTRHPRYTGVNHLLPPQRRRGLHPAADIALAIGLLVIDVIAPLIAFVFGLDAAGYQMFDPAADNSSVSLTRPFTYVSVVGGIVLVSALLLFMARAFISSGVQVLAGLVLVLVTATRTHSPSRPPPPSTPVRCAGPAATTANAADPDGAARDR